MAFAREIVESHEARQVIDNEIAHNPRLGDFWEGYKWFLARGPEHGYRADPHTDPPTYVIHFYHWNLAGVAVTYRFNENQVEILALKILAPG